MEGTPLDQTAREMLAALVELGPGWYSRRDVAAYLGKNKLNPVEIVTLDMLASIGKLERALRPTPSRPHINQWQYRIREE